MNITMLPRPTRTQYIAAAIISVLFGVICLFPAIAIRLDPAGEFQGIEMQASDAEYHYAARVQEVRDGFWGVGNVYFSSPKHEPGFQPPLPEIVISAMGLPFGLDAARSLLLSEFVFGALVCAVMIGCFRELTGRTWWSILGVGIFLYIGYAFSGPHQLLDVVHGGMGDLGFITFARPINPQWSASLFFGALWGFASWFRGGKRQGLIVAALCTIASFYSYVYAWSLLGVIYLIMGLRLLWMRDWPRVKTLLWLAAAILGGFIPYGVLLWQTTHHPLYAETAIRWGVLTSHQPVIGFYLVLIPCLTIVFWRRLGSMAWLVLAFAMAAISVENQQVITGHALAYAHFHWYFEKPFAAILGTILIGGYLTDRYGRDWTRRVHPVISVAVIVMALTIFSLLYQYRSYQAAAPFWRDQQSLAGTLGYLRMHAHPGEVVYATGFARDLVSVYTGADVYSSTNAQSYLSSDERIRDIYFFDLWLQGVTADEAAMTFPTSRREQLSSRTRSIYYREIYGTYAAIPDDEVNTDIALYRAYLAQPVEDRLKKYPLTYVIVARTDPATEGWMYLKTHSEQVYTDGSFEVRRLSGS